MIDKEYARYVLMVNGEIFYDTNDRDDALSQAHIAVGEKIGEWHRRDLPIKVTPEIAEELDVQLFLIIKDYEVPLPLQSWFDEYHQEMKDYKASEEEREWKQFLELREKFKDRIAEEKAL
jgi:hypothetical protein